MWRIRKNNNKNMKNSQRQRFELAEQFKSKSKRMWIRFVILVPLPHELRPVSLQTNTNEQLDSAFKFFLLAN